MWGIGGDNVGLIHSTKAPRVMVGTAKYVGYLREFCIDNLLVRIHRCCSWTGLAPWEFEFPFAGSLISTFLD